MVRGIVDEALFVVRGFSLGRSAPLLPDIARATTIILCARWEFTRPCRCFGGHGGCPTAPVSAASEDCASCDRRLKIVTLSIVISLRLPGFPPAVFFYSSRVSPFLLTDGFFWIRRLLFFGLRIM